MLRSECFAALNRLHIGEPRMKSHQIALRLAPEKYTKVEYLSVRELNHLARGIVLRLFHRTWMDDENSEEVRISALISYIFQGLFSQTTSLLDICHDSGLTVNFCEVFMNRHPAAADRWVLTCTRKDTVENATQAFFESRLTEIHILDRQLDDKMACKDYLESEIDRACHHWLCMPKVVTNPGKATAYSSRVQTVAQELGIRTRDHLTEEGIQIFCGYLRLLIPVRRMIARVLIAHKTKPSGSSKFQEVIKRMDTFIMNQGLTAYMITSQYGASSGSPLLASPDLQRDLLVFANLAEHYEKNLPYSAYYHFTGDRNAERFTPTKFLSLYSFALGHGLATSSTLQGLKYNINIVDKTWFSIGNCYNVEKSLQKKEKGGGITKEIGEKSCERPKSGKE